MDLALTASSKRNLTALDSEIGGSYIFLGPEGVGKYSAAKQLASKKVKNFENIIYVGEEGKSIGVEDIHSLRRQLQLKTTSDSLRVVLINNAHELTIEAQNALLKTLEEPPRLTSIILLTHKLESLTMTVRSRCGLVRFSRLDDATAKQYLVSELSATLEEAKLALALSGNRIGGAVDLINNPDELNALRDRFGLIRKFAQADLYNKLLLVPVFTEQAKDVLCILMQNLRTAVIKAISENDYSKAAHLNGIVINFIGLIDFIDHNGNSKMALDMAAIELAKT